MRRVVVCLDEPKSALISVARAVTKQDRLMPVGERRRRHRGDRALGPRVLVIVGDALARNDHDAEEHNSVLGFCG